MANGKKRFGLPWAGYQSSVPPHMAAPDRATSDGPTSSRRSGNFLYDPTEGKFYRRAGSTNVGGTAGILEDGTGELTVARARHLISLSSPSLVDGYPSHCVLYTEEGNHKGCVYLRSTNGAGSNYVIGKEFGANFYDTLIPPGNIAEQDFKVLPMVRTTDNSLGRLVNIAQRATSCPGGRKMIEVGDDLLVPNLNGTPIRWNKRYNDDVVDTENLRVWHVGSPSPLGLPGVTPAVIANSNGSWHEGDRFYISVAYRMADGSVTMPIIPRDRNDEVDYDRTGGGAMFGFGRVELKRSAGATKDERYLYLLWTTIPIGPAGTVGRYLLRTPKRSGVAVGQAGELLSSDPEPVALDLRITHYIDNNTQTTYLDPNGNDLALVADPLIVRTDHIMQPPARYYAAFDGRILCGYTNHNPVAFYLAPDVNAQDDEAAIVANVYEASLTAGVLTLKKNDSPGTAIPCDHTKTIQQVVDLINNTAAGGSGGKWFAAVAPGADASAYCSASAGANTNLVSVTGSVDLGDKTHATTGRMRCYGSSFPGAIFFSSSYLSAFPTQKQRIFFTTASPGMPTGAANAWVAGNYRTAINKSWGQFVGAAPLLNGAVCCFSNGIGVLQNRKAGGTGEDQDYRLYELNASRGCIAWDSIVEVNGVVGYLTQDGYVFTDGSQEVVISGDVWNPATRTGEWDYEIGQCVAGSSADGDLAHFHAKAMGGRLYCSYRLTGGVIPDRQVIYDFTGSTQFSGLRAVLRPDSTPWGWSTPLSLTVSVMGEVKKSDGVRRYGTIESNLGANSNGRVDQFEVGTTDNGTEFSSELWTNRLMADNLRKLSAQEMTMLYRKNGTGVTLRAYRDGLGTTPDATITLPDSGATKAFRREVLPLPQDARSPTEAFELQLTDDGTGPALNHWGCDLSALVLDSYD